MTQTELLRTLGKSMETKKDIRKRILEERSYMSENERWERSHSICKAVTTHPFFLNAKDIYCYLPVKGEVDTSEIINCAWNLGKRTAAPRIIGDEMEFFYFRSFDELKIDRYNIPAPKAVDLAKAGDAVMIMPGAVFDKERHRIGYGKGYYDRYLALHPLCKTIAIGFDFQVQEYIPYEEHDICPQYLITEEKIYG